MHLKRFFHWILLPFWVLFSQSISSVLLDPSISASVVQIRGVDPKGQLFFGSGVVIQKGWVATNCHVVRSGGSYGVFRGDQGFRVTHQKIDELHDICLLEVPELGQKPVRLAAPESLRTGEPLAYLGYPRALGLSYAEGTLLGVRRPGDLSLIETTAFFTLGGSGGGLFDREGRLVGLATFISRGHAGGYFAVGSDLILKAQRLKPDLVGPLSGRAFWEEPAFDKTLNALRHPSRSRH